jgi:hypothetical protein
MGKEIVHDHPWLEHRKQHFEGRDGFAREERYCETMSGD